MFQVPVSFFFNFTNVAEVFHPWVVREFVAAGAKHLIVTEHMTAALLQDPTLAKKYQKNMKDQGMSFVDAHAPYGKDIDLNAEGTPEQLKANAEQNIRLIEILASMGVDTVTIHLGNSYRFPGTPLADQIKRSEDALARILPAAEKNGVVVCIENIWSPNNTPDVLLDIKKKFPTEALGFCYDAGHANLMNKGRYHPGESVAEEAWYGSGMKEIQWEDQALEKMLPYIVNCHLHDNNGKKDQHYPIGYGNVDWQHIIPLLKKAPRLRNIQPEINPALRVITIASLVDSLRRLGEME